MFRYYLKLGLLSIRKNPMLSALMVAAIAVGIGACMTVVTVYYVMSGNPIPQKSHQLFYVQLDNWDPNDPYDEEDNLPPDQVTYRDATALLEAGRARTTGGELSDRPNRRTAGRRRTSVQRFGEGDDGRLLCHVRGAVPVWRRLGQGAG